MFIIWLDPWEGKINQILYCDWLAERAKMELSCRSGLSTVSLEKCSRKPHNKLLTKLVRSRWLDIGLDLFLRVYGPRAWPISSLASPLPSPHKKKKQVNRDGLKPEKGPYQYHYTRTRAGVRHPKSKYRLEIDERNWPPKWACDAYVSSVCPSSGQNELHVNAQGCSIQYV